MAKPLVNTVTIAVTQSQGDPSSLMIHALGLAGTPKAGRTQRQSIPVHEGVEITAVVATPHGIALADGSGRLIYWQCDLSAFGLESPSGGGDSVESADLGSLVSTWFGAPLDAISWQHPGHIVCGDRAGRLLHLDLDRATLAPDIIATAGAPWISSLPHGDEQSIAVAGDGSWAVTEHEGLVIREGRLPLGVGSVTHVQLCHESDLLLYQVTTPRHHNPDNATAQGHNTREWRGWHLSTQQPVPMPNQIRFAQSLVAASCCMIAMNAQGHSCRWSPGSDPFQNNEVHTLNDWPAGPQRDVGLLDEAPMLFQIDARGGVQILRLRDDTWHSWDLRLPTTQLTKIWAADPGVIDRAATSRHQQHQRQLADQILVAHQENRFDDRNRLMDQLSPPGIPAPGKLTATRGTQGGIRQNTITLTPESIRKRALLAQFAADEGDLLAALGHVRRILASEAPNPAEKILVFYGRLLWRTGAINELLSYDASHWPEVYDKLLSQIDPNVFHPDRNQLIDAYAPDQPGDCPWRELAWAFVKNTGTASPYWLGAEPLTPLSLLPDDQTLLGRAMHACGASPTSLSVLSPQGHREAATGWVFSDAISGTPVHRQLVAWLPGQSIETLNLRWAVKAKRFASAVDWSASWEALHDPAWRTVQERHLEIIRQSIACCVVPPLSMTRPQQDGIHASKTSGLHHETLNQHGAHG